MATSMVAVEEPRMVVGSSCVVVMEELRLVVVDQLRGGQQVRGGPAVCTTFETPRVLSTTSRELLQQYRFVDYVLQQVGSQDVTGCTM